MNYILGNDPSKWKLGLPTYERLTQREVYPGIDVVYYGNQQQLEFDMVLKPGAAPRSIRMKFEGAQGISLDASGALTLKVPSGDVRLALPEIYQGTGASKKTIRGRYVLRPGNEVGFTVIEYDQGKPLVIDPTILFGALFGGGYGQTFSQAVAVDAAGNIYLTGYTGDPDFPATSGAEQISLNGGTDGFVTKINPSGNAILYSTFIGGSQASLMQSIAVDSTGAVWVGGQTSSPDFPMVNPYQSTLSPGTNNVLAKLSPAGALVFSTYLGAINYASVNGVAVDTEGHGYFAGSTTGPFPTTSSVVLPNSGAIFSDGLPKAFTAKFTSSGFIVYSTLLGGNSYDYGSAVAADASGNAYVTGNTYSSSFAGAPSGGARPSNAGGSDAFIAKLNPTGTALVYFTFLGGSKTDSGTSITVDSSGNAYICGNTNSADLHPTQSAVQEKLSGVQDGFVAKLNAAGSVFSYITYLGGPKADYLQSLALETSSGNLYLAGRTEGTFPMVSPVQTSPAGAGTLLQTSNSGSSWTVLDASLPSVRFISPDPVTPQTLVVSSDDGIYRTTDAGSTWTEVATIASASLSRSFANSNTLYAMNFLNSYLSTDNGATWTQQGVATGYYAGGIIADPSNEEIAYSYTPAGVFKTTNSGATWTAAPSQGLAAGGVAATWLRHRTGRFMP